MDLKAHTARDVAASAARIPLGAGRLVGKRLPAPVGPTICKVVDTVDALLPQGRDDAAVHPEESATGPSATAPTPADMPRTAKRAARPSAAEVAAEEQSEVTTPVGTTGADTAYNPDTAETDLQQPGTEPLVDPSTTKKVASEAETLAKAADPKKE